MTPEALADSLHGRCAIPYADPEHPKRQLVLECYRPPGHTSAAPVVLVQHGMNRNGDEYRDAWIPAADRHGLLVVAITFPADDWPGAGPYNDGDVRAPDGGVQPRATWSNAIPARVFALLRAAGVTARPRAFLWGHSAGGQFVHRLMGLQGHDAWEAVGAANAGWYTLPTLDRPYPEGLGGIGLGDGHVERLLSYPMVVFAGDQDTETEQGNVPRHRAALAQGPHRFARARSFMEAGRTEALRRAVPFGWRLVVVLGVGHEGMVMSGAAAACWFEGRIPVATSRNVGAEA